MLKEATRNNKPVEGDIIEAPTKVCVPVLVKSCTRGGTVASIHLHVCPRNGCIGHCMLHTKLSIGVHHHHGERVREVGLDLVQRTSRYSHHRIACLLFLGYLHGVSARVRGQLDLESCWPVQTRIDPIGPFRLGCWRTTPPHPYLRVLML